MSGLSHLRHRRRERALHVVNDRHRKKRAMIFTTNKPLNQWGACCMTKTSAHAIVDRVLERGRFLTLDGPSMRTQAFGT